MAKQQLASAIIEFLQQSIKDGTIATEDTESIGVAIQCIAEAFQLGSDEAEWQQYSIRPATLQSIFDVYTSMKEQKDNGQSPNVSVKENNSDAAAAAEDFKSKGNKKLVEKNYKQAIELYSEAIKLQPSNAVYYANRAAAHSCLNQHAQAIEDCQKALTVDPNYGKAYSRLGLAQFSLGRYREAADAYGEAIRLDPTNEAAKQALKTAELKLQATTLESSTAASAPASGNTPKTGGNAPGGGLDFAALLSNPQLMSMATEFMKNPAASQMLQGLMGGAASSAGQPAASASPTSPTAADIGSSANNGASANPLAGLLNNPQLMSMAQQFMTDPNMRNMMGNLGGSGGTSSK